MHRQCTNKCMAQVQVKLGIKVMGYEKKESDRIYCTQAGQERGCGENVSRELNKVRQKVL